MKQRERERAETETETDRQSHTERQTDRQTDRQTETDRDRQRETEGERSIGNSLTPLPHTHLKHIDTTIQQYVFGVKLRDYVTENDDQGNKLRFL